MTMGFMIFQDTEVKTQTQLYWSSHCYGPGSAPGWGTDLLHGSAKKKRRYRSKYQNSQLKEVKVVFL